MVLPVVVLPQPDSPTSEKTSPFFISKETSSTALTTILFFPNPDLKYCFNPSTRKIVSLLSAIMLELLYFVEMSFLGLYIFQYDL